MKLNQPIYLPDAAMMGIRRFYVKSLIFLVLIFFVIFSFRQHWTETGFCGFLAVGLIVVDRRIGKTCAMTLSSSISIDYDSQKVVFRVFRLLNAFVLSEHKKEIVIPFGEILDVSLHSNRGIEWIMMRTIQGRIQIRDYYLPFDDLCNRLRDICAQNRVDRLAYQELLAKELKVKTPLYGIVILIAAMVLACAWVWTQI